MMQLVKFEKLKEMTQSEIVHPKICPNILSEEMSLEMKTRSGMTSPVNLDDKRNYDCPKTLHVEAEVYINYRKRIRTLDIRNVQNPFGKSTGLAVFQTHSEM